MIDDTTISKLEARIAEHEKLWEKQGRENVLTAQAIKDYDEYLKGFAAALRDRDERIAKLEAQLAAHAGEIKHQ